MARIFARIGVALAALVLSAQSAAALVTAPTYLTPAGQVAAAIGFTCINPDLSSCTFGGGISGYAQGSATEAQIGPLSQCATLASAPTYTTLTTNPCVTDIHGSAPVLVRDSSGNSVDLSASGSGIGATASAPPPNAVYMGANSGAVLTGLIQASAHASVKLTTATTTQIIALSGTTKTYITAAMIRANAAANVKLVYGTGSNCATGTTDVFGSVPVTTFDGFSMGSGLGPVLVIPAGQAVCGTSDAAVTANFLLSYTQF